MVEHQSTLCQSPYLNNAIFRPSKLKLVLVKWYLCQSSFEQLNIRTHFCTFTIDFFWFRSPTWILTQFNTIFLLSKWLKMGWHADIQHLIIYKAILMLHIIWLILYESYLSPFPLKVMPIFAFWRVVLFTFGFNI